MGKNETGKNVDVLNLTIQLCFHHFDKEKISKATQIAILSSLPGITERNHLREEGRKRRMSVSPAPLHVMFCSIRVAFIIPPYRLSHVLCLLIVLHCQFECYSSLVWPVIHILFAKNLSREMGLEPPIHSHFIPKQNISNSSQPGDP